MFKVIAINSSRRNMNTFDLINQVKGILNNNHIEVEIINLFDYDIKTCIGCEHCLINGGCVLKDDTAEIMDKIKSSDAIILSSPVYLENVSGKLKTFIDRTCSWFHRPEIYGKPVLIISTTKGSGLKFTLKYLKRVVIQWGGIYAGKIGRTLRNINTKVTEEECKIFIQYIKIENKENLKPTLNSMINFQVQKVLAYKLLGLDGQYWEEKGWNKEIYYYKCKPNAINKIIAISFGKFLNKVINN